jgi:hypothetical protein
MGNDPRGGPSAQPTDRSRRETPKSAGAKRRWAERGSRRSVSIAPTREPRRDAGPTAVARPVNKAPERGTVIATPACNDGGARERVPPASDTLFFCARDRSRMAETPRGSVHESPVRPLPHAPKQKSNEDKVQGSWTSSRALVCAS